MRNSSLNIRRKKLHLPISSLSRITKVPLEKVKAILLNPSLAEPEQRNSICAALGIDLEGKRIKSIQSILLERIRKKAIYVANLVQGTQALEASAVPSRDFQTIVNAAVKALRAGPLRKIWDED